MSDKKTTANQALNNATNNAKTPSETKKNEEQRKDGYPEIKPGMTIRVHQKIKEKNPKGEEKERIQVFEGIVITRRHGKEKGATITVRKVSGGIGVEKIFPLYSPNIANIEIKKKAKVRRANLSYLKSYKKRLQEKK